MTLVVCRKIDQEVFIHSDSKITQDTGPVLERELRHNLPLSGLLKTIFLHPHICLSFAGYTHPITEFLNTFFSTSLSEWSTDKLVASLFDLHSTSEGECEFILCEAVNRVPRIISIKDGKVQKDVPSAWIGSQRAFELYQSAFHSREAGAVYDRMRNAFRTVIDDDTILQVGHLHIEAYLDHHICGEQADSVFLYEWKHESDAGNEVQHIEANKDTRLIKGKAEFGAYGTSYFRSVSTKRHAVAIHFPHARIGVFLCPQIDCEQPIKFQNCSAEELLAAIWVTHRVAMEGMAMTSDGAFRFLRNYQ